MPPQKSCESVFGHTFQRSAMGLLIGAAWFLSPNTAHAEPPHYRIELSVPSNLPECNRKTELMGMLEPMLAGPLLEPPASRVMTMRIAKTQAVYRLDLLVKDLEGRPLDELRTELPSSMSCFEALYRGALRAALYMNLNATVSEPAPTLCPAAPPPPPPPASPPQCPACDKPTPEPPKLQPVDRHWFAGAGGLVGFGVAPEIVVGMQLLGGWRWSPSWSIELDVRATLPKDTRPLGPTIVRVYTVASVAIAPCYRIRSLGFCGLIMSTNAFASTINIDDPHVSTASFLGVGGRAFLENRLSNRWSFRVDVDIAAPMLRLQISEALRSRWVTAPLAGSLGASLLAWF